MPPRAMPMAITSMRWRRVCSTRGAAMTTHTGARYSSETAIVTFESLTDR